MQPPGKKPMNAADWARGARLDENAMRAAMTRPGKRRRPRKPLDPPARRPSTCCGRCPSATPTPTWRCPRCCGTAASAAGTPLSPPSSTYGTCRSRGLLDAVIAAAAGRPIDHIDPVLLDLLRLGSYQLLRTRVDAPRRGVHHRRAGRHRIRHCASGIRQRCAAHHRGVATSSPGSRSSRRPPTTDPVGHLAFVHAHPRWIAQAFADALGARAGELGALLASRRRAPRGAPGRPARRADRRRTRRRGRRHGRPVLAVRGVPARRRPGPARGRARRPGAGAGRGQPAGGPRADAGAARRAPTVAAGSICAPGPAARPRCWPRSARPSGRTRHRGGTDAAPRRDGRAEHPRPARRGASVSTAASRVWSRGFDRVLVDAPCTGLGALRRRPEARWRRQPGDVPPLAKLQTRTAGLGDRADPAGRRGAVRDLLAAPGRDRRAWSPTRCAGTR